MNTSFMRLLAQRLEHLSWTEVVPEECRFVEFFDSMDGFFMSGDLRFWDRPPGFIFGEDDCFIGQMEDWAVQLVQEHGGYYKGGDEEESSSDSWVDVRIDDGFSDRAVWLLACQALGLGSETEEGAFTLDNGLAHALLRPSMLFGRMRAVTPRKATKALRLCADGLGPQGAWKLIGQELRESRLKEMARILEKTEDGVPITRLTEWSHEELAEKLTHFSMQEPFCPWVMADGRWCGDIAMWAYKLYGANVSLAFGPAAKQNVSMVSSTLLGLTGMEARVLFEARVSPVVQGDLDSETFRKALTGEMAARVLRRLAGGVFPSAIWDVIHRGLCLDVLLNGAGTNEGKGGQRS